MEERWPAAYEADVELYEAFRRAEDEGGKLLSCLLEGSSFGGKKVLDVRCGTGKYLMGIAPLAAQYIGVDNSARMVDLARRRSKELTNVAVLRSDIQSLPFVENTMDVVFSSWLVGGIIPEEARGRAIAEVLRVLKPNGDVWLFENDREGEFMRIRERGSAEWARYRIDGMVGRYGFEIVARIRTNFRFPTVAEARRVLGFLLGERAIENLKRHPTRRIGHNRLILHKTKGSDGGRKLSTRRNPEYSG